MLISAKNLDEDLVTESDNNESLDSYDSEDQDKTPNRKGRLASSSRKLWQQEVIELFN